MFTDEDINSVESVEPAVSGTTARNQTPIRVVDDFIIALGLNDGDFAVELHTASGGWVELARPVMEIAAQAQLPTDISSREFADYIAALVPAIKLGLSAEDQRVLTVLAHLSRFTMQSAQVVLGAISEKAPMTHETHDSASTLMRLRMAGCLSLVADEERELFAVPSLLAASLRRVATAQPDSGELVTVMLTALVDHLESHQSVETAVLADVLVAARKSAQWNLLRRLQESFDLTLFLLAPEATCTAFAGLPTEAVEREPELVFSSAVTEELVSSLGRPVTSADVREVLVRETRAARMRDHLFSGEDYKGADVPEGYVATVRRIIVLAGADRHEEAARIGLQWRTGVASRRAELVVGLLAAISLFHTGRNRRALSILHEVEETSRNSHIPGDFLLPSATAWMALVAAVSCDHERADLCLDTVVSADWGECIVDELITPALHVARALRALDRLDLDRAGDELDDMARYPENRSLWTYLPALRRTAGVLSASSESGLLFVNDDVEKYRDGLPVSTVGRILLRNSRSMVYIALGQLKWAEREIENLDASSGERIVLMARVELVAGRIDSAIALVDTWFYHRSLTARSRAELAAIKAAALLRSNKHAEAEAEFLSAVRLSTWVSSLLPLAYVPQKDRVGLLDLTVGNRVWDEAQETFSAGYGSGAQLVRRLRIIGAAPVEQASVPQLSQGEAQLLELLAQGYSVLQISDQLNQVRGTVKNRLSALYRKFEVSNRREVIDRARSLGFIRPD